ncbi:MAG: hypothetical protein D3917_16980, partial [Candidatus Electrothrix sp. AX5]|nr:hypothetical protein [Candidatus Electrothrix sp. AX5]
STAWLGKMGMDAILVQEGTARFLRLVTHDPFEKQVVWAEKEKLDRDAAFRETVIMGLRMTVGLSLLELTDRFDMKSEMYYGETLHRLIRQGMLQIVHDRLQLTAQGLLLANTVMAELV